MEQESDDSAAQPSRTCEDDGVPRATSCGPIPTYLAARTDSENRRVPVCACGPHIVARTGVTVIPVVVHVVYNDRGAEHLGRAGQEPDRRPQRGLPEDERRRRQRAGRRSQPLAADARIEFELATTDPAGNPTDGITRTQTTQSSASPTTTTSSRAATGGADAWPARQLPEHLGRASSAAACSATRSSRAARRDRRRRHPAHRLRHHRHRGGAVQPRPHRDPRGRPLAEPAPHLGRRRHRLHRRRLRRRHAEPGGPELRRRRPSRTSPAATGRTATCS